MRPAANILIVDDDESMREGCTQTLAEEGYRVQAAPDGLAGLKLASQESFDLAVLDLKMPKMNGMQMLSRLREEQPTHLRWS